MAVNPLQSLANYRCFVAEMPNRPVVVSSHLYHAPRPDLSLVALTTQVTTATAPLVSCAPAPRLRPHILL